MASTKELSEAIAVLVTAAAENGGDLTAIVERAAIDGSGPPRIYGIHVTDFTDEALSVSLGEDVKHTFQ